jgi:Integrase core domain
MKRLLPLLLSLPLWSACGGQPATSGAPEQTASLSEPLDAAARAATVAEGFFATLKGELVDHEAYATRAAATASIGDYIDAFYNTHRRHSTIGYVSPIEFELKLQSARRAT